MGGLQLTNIEVELIAETLTFCGGEDGTENDKGIRLLFN